MGAGEVAKWGALGYFARRRFRNIANHPQPPPPPFPRGMLAQGPGQARGETPAPPRSHPPHPRGANSFLSAPGPPAGPTDRPGPPQPGPPRPPPRPGRARGPAGKPTPGEGEGRAAAPFPVPSLPSRPRTMRPRRAGPGPGASFPQPFPTGERVTYMAGARGGGGGGRGREPGREPGEGEGRGERASERAGEGGGRRGGRAGSAAGAERRPHWAPGSRRLLLTIPGRRGGSSSPSRRRSARGVRTPAPAAGSPSPPLRPARPPPRLASPRSAAASPRSPGPGWSRTAFAHTLRRVPPLPARAEGPPRSAPLPGRGWWPRCPPSSLSAAEQRPPARPPPPSRPRPGPRPRGRRFLAPGGPAFPFPGRARPGALGTLCPAGMWPLLARPVNPLPGAWTISQNHRIN